MIKFIPALLLCFLISLSDVNAKEIKIGMGNFKPYFYEEDQSGIAADIINEAFALMPDYNVKYRFGLSVKGAWGLFEQNGIDAVANLFDTVKMDACRSDPVIRFRDVAISRASANLKIESIEDLQKKNVVAFEGAKVFFGTNYSKSVQNGPYMEFWDQNKQPFMLDGGRADVSVGDLFIFLYGLSQIPVAKHKPNEFVIHDIFPQISSRIAFHDPHVCKEFNKALKIVKESGKYEAIYQKYYKSLGYNPQ